MATGREFTLRRARPEDAAVIADIHLRSRRHGLPYLPEVHTDAETRYWVSEVMLPQQEVWVAEAAGGVAGFAALHEGWLEHLYIAPEHQGYGLGSALLFIRRRRISQRKKRTSQPLDA